MKICLEPQSGRPIAAAQTSSNTAAEATLNSAIARKVGDQLYKSGYEVVYSCAGYDISGHALSGVIAASKARADAFISINCCEAACVHGVQTAYYPESKLGLELAAHIQTELATMNHIEDRGLKSVKLSGLKSVGMPAVLVECSLRTTEEDGVFFVDPYWQDMIANAITAGIQLFFG